MQSLHAAPSVTKDSVAIAIDVENGSVVASARNPVARRSPSRRVTSSVAAKNARNANTDIAGSETGIPPQNVFRSTDEYGLIIVTPQPELPGASSDAIPGTNEQ